jgi:signal transduction histidine kinase
MSANRADEQDLAIRELSGSDSEWLLRATLSSSDIGMLVTSLDGQVIAANRRFGELMGVDHRAVEVDQLDGAICGEPDRDALEIRRNRLIISRTCALIKDADGRPFGRLWTYRDVTRETRQQEMNEVLVAMGSEFVADTDESLRRVLKALKKFHPRTSAILSIRDGNCMQFRAIDAGHPGFAGITQNEVQDSFCQFALQMMRPLMIQDARLDPVFGKVPAALFGLTRYLGVPIFGETEEPVGTLCIIDEHSDEPLDDLDLHFITMLAVQVSGELARERHTQQRVAEHAAQAERQRADLAATHSVLEAMNAAFGLVWSGEDLREVLRGQTRLLAGLMGYRAAAVGIRRARERSFKGFFVSAVDSAPKPFELVDGGLDREALGSIAIGSAAEHPVGRLLGTEEFAYGLRIEQGLGEILVAFGGPGASFSAGPSRVLLTALADQVCLLVGTHILKNDLDLTSQKLGEAQEQLLEREKLAVVGTLAAGTAHDIRNILSSLALLLSPTSTPDARGLDAIREQIGRFNVLAYRLMSYAKPRLIVRQPVDLPELMDTVLGLTAGQLRVGKVKLVRRIPAGLPHVSGDPHEYEQVFVNLIMNGVQSMASRGGVLTVRASVSGGEVVVRVGDDGVGISPEIRQRLFEPFASTRSDGFGLGLFSCKRIVEHHGGSISARSNPKAGSTFSVRLPVYRS